MCLAYQGRRGGGGGGGGGDFDHLVIVTSVRYARSSLRVKKQWPNSKNSFQLGFKVQGINFETGCMVSLDCHHVKFSSFLFVCLLLLLFFFFFGGGGGGQKTTNSNTTTDLG